LSGQSCRFASVRKVRGASPQQACNRFEMLEYLLRYQAQGRAR
jgi:hypothetical protein